MSPTNGAHDDDGIDFSDIEAKYQIPYEEGFDNVLVIDNLPIVDLSRRDKLLTVVSKHFTKKSGAPKPGNMFMPWDDAKNKSKGYVFAEFNSADEATVAMNAVQGSHLDKDHPLIISRFTDIEKFANLDEHYVEPVIEPYKPKEYLRSWLGDPESRDQFVILRDNILSVRWHGKGSSAEVAMERPDWTDLYASWSPNGTYIASIHRQGVRLWGGPSWDGLLRIAHPFVKLLDFSPGEQYIVTWSPEPITIMEGAPVGPNHFTEDDEGNQIAIWDIKTGRLLRTFPVVTPPPTIDADGNERKKQFAWPALKWSSDDKYVARVTPGQQISVYETPSMGLSGKKSIKIEGVVDFEWCPIGDKDKDREEQDAKKGIKKEREAMLAYWTPEVANQPARVTLMSFPGRAILRSKNLFNVSDCKIHWQNQGDFLCVKVDRHTKTKKSIFCNMELFRVREKDYPVEVIEIKDTVLDFAWEPRGERFAIIHSSDPNIGNIGPGISIKTEVSFYQLERTKGDFKLLRTLSNRTTNTIRWAPRGRYVVLTTTGNSNNFGLEFWDLDFTIDDRKEGPVSGQGKDSEWGSGVQLLSPPSTEHYGLTDIEWDPSGRYVATSASAWRHTIENGYAIWDFRGVEQEKVILDKFKQFLWRPRPRTLLSKEQQKAIRRNLKEYSRTFDEEDAAEESSASKELVAHRKRLVDEWNAWRVRIRKDLEELKGIPATAPIVQESGEKEEVKEWMEEEISVEEEILD